MEVIWLDAALDGLERVREYVAERNSTAVGQGTLTILAVQHGAQEWPESFDLC